MRALSPLLANWAKKIEGVACVDPDDFVRWVFPHLFAARIPRYEAIAQHHGYTVTTKELWSVRDEADFLDLVSGVLARVE